MVALSTAGESRGGTMRAARIHEYGGPDVFRIEEVPRPTLHPFGVRIAVYATSVNPIDLKIRAGGQRAVIRPKFPAILGMDASGVVTEVGARVTRFAVGDEVFSSPSHRRMGTYAEEIVVRESEVAHKPKTVGHAGAAALPLVGLTAWDALVSAMKLRAGQRVMIQAGSGGVGTVAIQLAKHLGAHVSTTTSGPNAAFVRELGADRAIDYREERFEEVARGVDGVLESMGGDAMLQALETVRRGGTVVTITTGLPHYTARFGPALGFAVMLAKLVWLMTGALLRGRKLRVVARTPSGANLAKLAELVDRGALRPVIDRTFALEQIAEAHRYVESGHARGKVVIAVR